MNPFTWLRRKAAEAFALGVNDALIAITPEGELPPTDLAGLRALVAVNLEPKAITLGDDERTEVAARRKSR